jgi:FkbM family methyltransferase
MFHPKHLIQQALSWFGLELHRIEFLKGFSPGSATRPIGRLESFLKDIKARGFQPRGIIDGGGHRGEWSKLALSVFGDTPLIIIEPQEELYKDLSILVKAQPNCQHIKAGIGRASGTLIQTIWEDYAGSSFLPPVQDSLLESGKQRMVMMTTLDQILEDATPEFYPDLVKLDIQGFELEALSGGQSLFGTTEVFIIETSLFPFMPNQPITSDIIRYMSERSYEIYDITEFARRPIDGALGQVDLAFVKSDGVFRKSEAW